MKEIYNKKKLESWVPIHHTKYYLGFDLELFRPYKWKMPRKIIFSSGRDLFHPDISVYMLTFVFKVMNDTPRHTYHIYTKYPGRISKDLLQHVKQTKNIFIIEAEQKAAE